jgi:hypothetical protein
MILKLTSIGTSFLLEDVGVIVEAAPGSTFEDTNLLLDLSKSKALQAKVLAGDVIVGDGVSEFLPSAGLQYLASIWSQGGLSTVVRMASALSTGLLFGGLLSVNGVDNTKFDMTAGGGIVVDNYSDPANPTLKYVEWPARIGETDPHIAASTETYIYIDGNGSFIFTTTKPTCIERRVAINVGWTSHPDYLTLEDAYTEPTLAIDPINQMADFAAALGAFNIFGNEYAAQSNLKIERNAGAVWDEGANYKNNPKQPHVLALSLESPVVYIWYFHRDPGDPSGWNNNLPSVGDIDPDNYDDGTGVLAPVPVGKFTVQLITLYAPWNVTDIQYGQVYYDTLADAVEHVPTDFPVLNPWNSEWDVLRGWLVVQEGTTDLTDPAKAKFLTASRFGSIMGIGGGGGGGEVNTASNQGTAGIGPFLAKVGVDLGFKNIRAASTKLTVANNTVQKTVDVDLGPHKTTHENGGTDQMTVAGLTGLLATAQTPATHALSGLEHTGSLSDVQHGNRSGGSLHSIAVAGISDGFLAQADKTLYDNHVASTLNPHATTAAQVGAPSTSRAINTQNGLQGGGDLSADRTLSPTYGSAVNTVCQGNDARLSDARIPTVHKDSHKSGGTDALLSTDLIEAIVKRIRESAGPTNLLVGAIADGQFLKRSGTGIVGDTPVFGSNFVEASVDAGITYNGSVNFQVRTTLNSGAIPAGKYRVGFHAEIRCVSSISDDIKYRVQQNATIVLAQGNIEVKDQTNYFPVSGFIHITLAAATYSFTLEYGLEVAANTVAIRRARLEFWRVS